MGHDRLAILGGTPVRTPGPFSPWPVHGPQEEQALLAALRAGPWGVHHLPERPFEDRFAAYCQTKHCIAMCNGSVTLRNALLALGIERGDEVIVPPYTFQATAISVVEANAVPVFADIEQASWGLDPAAVEAAITPRTRGIIVVHLGGVPADMDALTAIARRHGLFVIEDAAHAHGSEHRHRRVGSIGDVGSFSFQSSKALTSGEGGAIVTNDQELADRCYSLHNCGRRRVGGQWYEHATLGSNYRLGAFQHAILLAQLDRLDGQIDTRMANARILRDHLGDFPGLRVRAEPAYTTRNGLHLLQMEYSPSHFDGLGRDSFLRAMVAEGTPITAGYQLPLYQQPVFRERDFMAFSDNFTHIDYSQTHCPVTEQVCAETGCWLGQATLLGTPQDMRDIASAAFKVYEHRHELLKTQAGANA